MNTAIDEPGRVAGGPHNAVFVVWETMPPMPSFQFRCPYGTRLLCWGDAVPPVNWRAIFSVPSGTFASLRFALLARKSPWLSRAQVPEGPSDNSPAFLTPGRPQRHGTASRRDA